MSGFNRQDVKFWQFRSDLFDYDESIVIYGKNMEILDKIDIYIKKKAHKGEKILIVYGKEDFEYITTSLALLAGYYMIAHNTNSMKSFFSDELEKRSI